MKRERIERGLFRYHAQDGSDTYIIDCQRGGKRIQKTLPRGTTKREAQDKLAAVRKAAKDEALFPEDAEKRKQQDRKSVRFSEFATIYFQEKEAQLRDMDSRRSMVKRLEESFFGGRWIHHIGPSEIRGMVRDLKKRGNCPVTVSKYLSCLRDLLEVACELELLDTNPARSIKGPQIPPNARQQYLKPDECWALLSMCEPWLAALLEMYLRTGCRRAELIGLTWDGVRLEPSPTMPYSSIRIDAEREKSGRGRTIPLDARGRELLLVQREKYPAGLVFRNRRGLKIGDFRKTLDKAAAAAKLDSDNPRLARITPHVFRHTWATNCSNAGVPPRVLQKLGGWSSLAMVERYSKAGEEAKAEGIFRMSEYLDSRRGKSVGREKMVDFPVAVNY